MCRNERTASLFGRDLTVLEVEDYRFVHVNSIAAPLMLYGIRTNANLCAANSAALMRWVVPSWSGVWARD